ncbi:hypothetical protein BABINDRAFT_165656 [Babjeviella inositovora NRRL Y-12698]|uniref:Glucose starvation modulator protein 1 n=1 Tax=Babjeviella inositovora NRRL Y-12698 TaxID=984486 RepID=A0A1E3QV24_9ASCO|nr:uncharacterized protein BABINDRAFT_165656 [Babjeviella inositovora NRRL Y-12698]ODQ80902.1 hypothetical protein BABINDRAFT_165656 [Babjeviella inositovora NRRL Y-12698]
MTKKLTEEEKQRRKPTTRACVFCHSKHLQCDSIRPCTNCTKRGHQETCTDIVRRKNKYLAVEGEKPKKVTKPKTKKPKVDFVDPVSNTTTPSVVNSPQTNEGLPMAAIIGGAMGKFSYVGVSPSQISDLPAGNTNMNADPMFSTSPMVDSSAIGNTGPLVDATMNVDENHSTNGHTRLAPNGPDTSPRLSFLARSMKPTLLGLPSSMKNSPQASPGQMFAHLNPALTASTPHSDSQYSNLPFDSIFTNQEYAQLTDLILKTRPSSPSSSETDVLQPYVSNIDNTTFPPKPRKAMFELGGSPVSLSNRRTFISLADIETILPDDQEEEEDPSVRLLHSLAPPHEEGMRKNKLSINISGSTVSTAYHENKPLLLPWKLESKYVPPDVYRQIVKTPQDLYRLQTSPFEYPASYHALTSYLKRRFLNEYYARGEIELGKQKLIMIIRNIATYRPTFISTYKNLILDDFIYQEMSLQRSLLDYESFSRLLGLPTLYWRRTGELCGMSLEFSSLTGWFMRNLYKNEDGTSSRTRRFIFEMMDDDSIVNYFELFKGVAVGNLSTQIKTQCCILKAPGFQIGGANNKYNQSNLRLNEEDHESRKIMCQSVWTIKRDLFDLPMLMVGVFLPILPGSKNEIKKSTSWLRFK